MVLRGVSNVQSPFFPAKRAGCFTRTVVTVHHPGLEDVQITANKGKGVALLFESSAMSRTDLIPLDMELPTQPSFS